MSIRPIPGGGGGGVLTTTRDIIGGGVPGHTKKCRGGVLDAVTAPKKGEFRTDFVKGEGVRN